MVLRGFICISLYIICFSLCFFFGFNDFWSRYIRYRICIIMMSSLLKWLRFRLGIVIFIRWFWFWFSFLIVRSKIFMMFRNVTGWVGRFFYFVVMKENSLAKDRKLFWVIGLRVFSIFCCMFKVYIYSIM